MEQKCIDAPMNCLVNASKQNGNGQFARSNGNHDNNAIAMETDSNAMTNDRASMIKDQIEQQNMIGDQEYIDVSFDNGTVRLMGLVHSKRKRDQIGAFVQSLDGVRQVDNQLTIDTSFLKR
jgi:osmotically-inducible protein OsmY